MSYQELLARACELREKIAELQVEIDAILKYNSNCTKDMIELDSSYEQELQYELEKELDDVEDEIYRMVGC